MGGGADSEQSEWKDIIGSSVIWAEEAKKLAVNVRA